MTHRTGLLALLAVLAGLAPIRGEAATAREYARACIAAAEGALLDDDVAAARAWLSRVPPGERALEWRLLHDETDRSVRVLPGSAAALTDVASAGDTPAGDRLAVVAADGSLSVHDVRSGTVLARALAHRGEAWAVAAHAGRGLLASCGADGMIRIARLDDAGAVATIEVGANRRATDVAFSLDGMRLAAALTSGRVRAWDVCDPAHPETLATLVGHVDRPPVAAVTFLPDGRVASGSWDQWTKVWDLATRTASHTFGPGYGTSAPYSRFDDLAVAPGGGRLLAASAHGVHGFALDGADSWLREEHAGAVTCVAVRRADGLVASGGEDRTVRLWHGADGAPRALLRGHTGALTGAAFGVSGALYTTAADSTLRTWDPGAAAARAWAAHGQGTWGLALSADGRTLATCSTDDTLALWQRDPAASAAPRRLRAIGGFDPGAAAVVLSRDGGWGVVATNAGRVQRFAVPSGDSVVAYPGHTGAVQALALSRDEGRVITAGADGTVRVFAATTGESLHVFRPGAGRAAAVAIAASGRLLAAGFADGSVHLFDLDGGTSRRLEGPGGTITALAIHPAGGTIVAATERGELRAWDVRTGRVEATRGGHRGATYGLAFTPEGARLVSASYDRTVRLWDPADWALVGTLRAAPVELYGVAIAAEAASIAVGGLDGSVHMFVPRP